MNEERFLIRYLRVTQFAGDKTAQLPLEFPLASKPRQARAPKIELQLENSLILTFQKRPVGKCCTDHGNGPSTRKRSAVQVPRRRTLPLFVSLQGTVSFRFSSVPCSFAVPLHGLSSIAGCYRSLPFHLKCGVYLLTVYSSLTL